MIDGCRHRNIVKIDANVKVDRHGVWTSHLTCECGEVLTHLTDCQPPSGTSGTPTKANPESLETP